MGLVLAKKVPKTFFWLKAETFSQFEHRFESDDACYAVRRLAAINTVMPSNVATVKFEW